MEAFHKKSHTYADYEKLPQRPAYQLIDGDLVMTPAPTPYHQTIVGRMFLLLNQHVQDQDLGLVFVSPIDIYLSDTETYQPDVVFIAKANRQIVGEKKIEGAPDLVVEILSAGAGHYDSVHKKIVYQTSGVKEYWIVDPEERSIEIFQNIGSGFRLGCSTRDGGSAVSTLLSGFSVDPTILFRPILD